MRYFLGIVGILRFTEFFLVVDSSQYFDTPILSLCFQNSGIFSLIRRCKRDWPNHFKTGGGGGGGGV